MFAGPNGSGKSTLKSVLPSALLGFYLNPDELELRGDNFVSRDTSINTVGDCMREVEALAVAGNISDDHRKFIVNRFKFIKANWPGIVNRQPSQCA